MHKEIKLYCNICGAVIYNPTNLFEKCVICGSKGLKILKDNIKDENKERKK